MNIILNLKIEDERAQMDRILHNIARQFSVAQSSLIGGTVEVDGVKVGSWNLENEEEKAS